MQVLNFFYDCIYLYQCPLKNQFQSCQMFILSDSHYVGDTYILFWSKNSKETSIKCKYHEDFILFLQNTLLCKIQCPISADSRLLLNIGGLSKMKHFLISITQYVIKIGFCLADSDNLFTLIALYQIGRVRIFVRL